eukprot:GHVO01033857.1.p1 GENE.GHVO01033857.1~~GHVO01033857.1.p1  ORF type:complete len:683 (-),score=10.83 GHVO01033857.1:116-2164(-)
MSYGTNVCYLQQSIPQGMPPVQQPHLAAPTPVIQYQQAQHHPHPMTYVTSSSPRPRQTHRTRSMTDSGCFVIFAVFLAGMGIVALYSLMHGEPARLYKGVNFNGKTCGYHAGVQQLPYLYYPLDPSNSNSMTLLVEDGRCVKFCPSSEDVKAGRTIPVTKRHTEPGKDGGSVLTVEYNLHTPAYSSEIVGNALCLPKESRLRAQAAHAFGIRWRQIAFAIGSMSAAFPVMISYAVVGVAVAIGITSLLQWIPSLVLWVSSIYLVCTMIGGGISLMHFGNRGLIHDIGATIFMLNYRWTVIIGAALVISGVAVAFSLWAAGGALNNAVKSLELANDVLYDIPGVVMLAPFTSAGAIFIWMILWIGLSLYVFSLGEYVTGIIQFPLGLNGGGQYLSLHRHLVYPISAVIAILYWCLGSCWIMETINSFSHFVVAYTGTAWYFSPPVPGTNGKERNVGPSPSLFALYTSLSYHIGSFAIGGIVMGITRLFRTFFCWASSKYARSRDPCLQVLLHTFDCCIVPIRHLVDTFSTAGYVEMALSSLPFHAAMVTSARRHCGGVVPPSARLTGSVTMISWVICGCVSLTMALLCHLSVTKADYYTHHSSASYVASPIFVSAVTAVFVAYLTAQFTAVYDVTADSLLYSFTVEAFEAGADDHTGKFNAPPQLRQLLLSVMEDDQGGCLQC